MKFFGAAAVLVAGTGAWASDPGNLPQRVVTVCLNPGEVSVVLLSRGRSVATQILKQAGIRLEWKTDEHACHSAGNSIVVAVSPVTPEGLLPGALAYATPYGRSNIVLFFDRVLRAGLRDFASCLLGYVLAHEIAHILQVTDRHSASGIMKPRWGAGDYSDMVRWRLTFTEGDIALIQIGWDLRSRMAPAE